MTVADAASRRKPCPLCGCDHEPLDPARRYFYAMAPGSPYHAAEIAWFEKHGISIAHELRQIEAFCLAHGSPADA